MRILRFQNGIHVLLNSIAFLVELIFCVPLIGRTAKWLWNLLLTLPSIFSLVLEMILPKLGVHLEKKMRVGVLVLNAPGVGSLALPEEIQQGLRFAERVFSNQANVRLIPIQTQGEPLAEDPASWIRYEVHPSPQSILDTHCNLSAMLDDLWLTGSRIEYYMATRWFESNFRRVLGLGAPLIIFVVRGIKNFGGCSLGPLSDYVTVTENRLICIAHELGHAANLPHTRDPSNLLHHARCDQPRLTAFQVAVLRASRHVSYF